MLELPLWPSLVAVIVTEPAACAVTTPDVDTVAMLASLVAHCTARPVTVSPAASVVIASIWRDAPTDNVTLAGFTLTAVTGGGAIDTVPESANVPVVAVAWTRYVPDVAPAVYRPSPVIVPPWAV